VSRRLHARTPHLHLAGGCWNLQRDEDGVRVLLFEGIEHFHRVGLVGSLKYRTCGLVLTPRGRPAVLRDDAIVVTIGTAESTPVMIDQLSYTYRDL